MTRWRKARLAAGAFLLGLAVVASACGGTSNSTSSKQGAGSSGVAGASSSSASSGGAMKIALLLPETSTSPRYEAHDKPDFEAEVKQLDPGVQVIYSNAQGDPNTQIQQIEAAISNGAKVLVLDPVDAKAVGPALAKARSANIPIISYDRLITGTKIDYYISFDNERVGRLQGQYVADHTRKGGTVVMIDGAQTDNNALLFAKGAHDVLDPLFKSGTFKLGYESFTPDWDSGNGLREMEQALTRLGNKVDGVVAANDNLAGAVIQALQPQGLAGKIPVTGQDATDFGLRNIVLGLQSMTVYKPIRPEAQAAAKLAVALAQGKPAPSGLVNSSINNGAGDVPAVLLTPIVVTKASIADTVIKDGYTTWAKICAGIPASSCPSH